LSKGDNLMSNADERAPQPTTREALPGLDTQKAEPVTTERRGATWIVTLNRPAVRNAIDGPTALALASAFRQFERDDTLLVAVLTGAGETFCAGADLTTATDARRALHVAEDGDAPSGLARLQLSKPCLAAIEGYALGGGFELALWCDLRVAATSAILGLEHHRWGIPSMDGATVLLPRLIGQSRALDLILSGRRITGEEASAMGLVNRLVAEGTALEAALALAQEIARFPQGSLRADRLSCYEQWSLPYQEALLNETRHSLPVLRAEGAETALRRFIGRKERFSSL
jgi:enoyl-CoA hydratase